MSRPIGGKDVYRAVAHPVRRKMIELLEKQPLTPGELKDSFKISQPSLSQHLRVLRDARLVQQRRVGIQRRYTLNANRLHPIAQWVNALDKHRE